MGDKVFTDFYKSWVFLCGHEIFRDNAFGGSHFRYGCLDTAVVKVNPMTLEIDDNNDYNLKTRVWLECGEYSIEHNHASHDYDLDCGADTFEEAIVELANLVYRKFGGTV
jgi:hypothetical protein